MCYKKSLLKFLRILTSFGSILPHNFLTKETNELLAQVSTLIKSTTPKSHFYNTLGKFQVKKDNVLAKTFL